MKGIVRPVRFPEDFDAVVLLLGEQQNKTRTQLVRGALIQAWPDFFANQMGYERLEQLVAEYIRPEAKNENAESEENGESPA